MTLDGTGSFDADDEPLTFAWQQTAGLVVTLEDPTAAQPAFTAPLVEASGSTLTFTLTVSDGLATATATTRVLVANINQAPVADAGTAQTVQEGTVVHLDGTGSRDPDGDALTYAWAQLSGPVVDLSDGAAAQPTVTVPLVAAGGEALVFALTAASPVPRHP